MNDQITLLELFTKAGLEKKQTFFVVEGNLDQHVYDLFLEANKKSEFFIYPVNRIDVPKALISTLGYSVGSNKDAVKTLIRSAYDSGIQNLYGIVDLDFDHFVFFPSLPNLLFTDLHSLEAYAFEFEILQATIAFNVKGDPKDFYERMGSNLKMIFIAMAVNYFNYQKKFPDFKNSLRADGVFDIEGFLRSLFSTDYQKAKKEFEILMNICDGFSPGLFVNGHHLVDYFNALQKKSKLTEEILLALLRQEDYLKHPLFNRLLQLCR